jgi:L-fuconolactonase
MFTIDSHQHFWKYDPVKHSWINDNMAAIRKDFLPEQLLPVLTENGVNGCVAVQTDQSAVETDFLIHLSSQHDFIKGVVGWVELKSPFLADRLQYYREFDRLKGFRHILQGEQQRDFCLQPAFLNGIALLEQYGYTYDILIVPDQLQYLPDFVGRFPNQRFVIDHMAKPAVASGEIADWKKDIEKIAAYPNVSCKISGLVTEADLTGWKNNDFRPYIDVVVNAFGMKRVMYGSDWPVCLYAGGYPEVIGLVRSYFSTFSEDEQQLFFASNAINFYRL